MSSLHIYLLLTDVLAGPIILGLSSHFLIFHAGEIPFNSDKFQQLDFITSLILLIGGLLK